jgi:uncharacterized tellurite resistance protein B-like protein
MFDRFLAFLESLGGGAKPSEKLDADDPRVAAAALLFCVMDADGTRLDVEKDALSRELADYFGDQGQALQEVLSAGEEAEGGAVDLYQFTSVLMRALDAPRRLDFVESVWEVVYADHELHELEDNLVWRMCELLGVSARDRVLLKHKVAARTKV